MKEFLRSVAEHYFAEAIASRRAEADGMPAHAGLADYLFVFPNRRSGLFFNHYLSGLGDRPVLAPDVATTGEVFQRLSDLALADRTELLFRLYAVYRRQNPAAEDFDQFVFWGDMLLADFDDVDKYLVDARRLFANVRDLKDIDALFADYPAEVLRIVRSFWRNAAPAGATDGAQGAFLRTWSILHPLYTAFRQRLHADGLAYEGMLQRDVVERLRAGQDGDDALGARLPGHVVFVGLTAISRADRELMLWLRRRGGAEFCWDYADERLRTAPGAAAGASASAAYFTMENLSDFPNALPDEELHAGLVPDAQREVRVYNVASGVGQTAQAGQLLRQWMDQGVIDAASRSKDDPDNAFRTAVVLPDERLLIPMLYAVPSGLEPFNVTMGYSLKATPVAALMDGVARLQAELRTTRRPEGADVAAGDGGTDIPSRADAFYYKTVLPLLAHNYTAALSGETARRLAQRINRDSLYAVPCDLLGADDWLRLLFRPVRSAAEAVAYVGALFDHLLQQPAERFGDVEREFLTAYAQVADRLAALAGAQAFTFTARTYFMLLSRLAQGVTVPFSGEPLAGLQVMGVLETRAVDFTNVIVLSMNEGIFPARPVGNTFVPMSLRQAFGMPTQRHRDAVFAYHFYRLLSRARRVALVYDSRTDGMQTGEPSRYLMQLRYLYGFPMEVQTVHRTIGVATATPFEVPKTPDVMAALDAYRTGGGRAFSATAFKAYLVCPMRFYMQYVLGLREDEEVVEGIDARQLGSVLHGALQYLYDDLRADLIQSDVLLGLAKDRRRLDRYIGRAFAEVMRVDGDALSGYLRLVDEIILTYVQNVLRHDAALCPFRYLKSEHEDVKPYDAGGGLAVQLKCIYDRLDITRGGSLRIVDYKTSRSTLSRERRKTVFPSVKALFGHWARGRWPDEVTATASEEAFQVMMYCMVMASQPTTLPEAAACPRIEPHLYFIRDFHDRKAATVLEWAGQGEVSDFAPLRDEFEEVFRLMLHDIYDPAIPFRQCDDDAACQLCPFKTICKR